MFSFFRQPSKRGETFKLTVSENTNDTDNNDKNNERDGESPTLMSTKSVTTDSIKNITTNEDIDEGPPPLLTLSAKNLPDGDSYKKKNNDDDARSEASSVAPSVMSTKSKQNSKPQLVKQKSGVSGFFSFFTKKQDEEVAKEEEPVKEEIPDGGNSPEYEDVNRIEQDEWNPVIDYYEILGVQNKYFKYGETDPRYVSSEEIDKGFKKMSELWNPGSDRNFGDKLANEKFKKIKVAYDVLSDAQKRRWYNIKGDPEDIKKHKDDDGFHPDDEVEPAPLGGIPMVFNAVFGKLIDKLKRADDQTDEFDGIFANKDEVPEKICLQAYKLIDEGWLLEKPELDNPEVEDDDDEEEEEGNKVDSTIADIQKELDDAATGTATSGASGKGGGEPKEAGVSDANTESVEKKDHTITEGVDEAKTGADAEAKITPSKSITIAADTAKANTTKSSEKKKNTKKKTEKKILTDEEKEERKKDTWVEPIKWCEPYSSDIALRGHPRFARLYVNEEHAAQGFIIMIRSESRGNFSFTIFDDEKNIVCLQHAARTRDNRFAESAYYSTHFETFKIGDIPIEKNTDVIFTKLDKFGRTENEKLEAGRYLLCVWGTNFIGYTTYSMNVVPFRVDHNRIVKKLQECDRNIGSARSDILELYDKYAEIKEKYYSVLKEVHDHDIDIDNMIKKREKYYNKIYNQSWAPWAPKQVEEIVEKSQTQEAANAAAAAASAAANEAAVSAAGGMQSLFKKASALATFVITRKMPVDEEALKKKEEEAVKAKEEEEKLNEKVGDQFEALMVKQKSGLSRQASGLGTLERRPSLRRKSLSSRSVDSNDDADSRAIRAGSVDKAEVAV